MLLPSSNKLVVLLFPSQSSQPATKMRPFSTLDPELMLNPEALPRASTVAMTKEYSFLRTSVPRGPKVGSLGLLAHPKEKKSSKSSKIRSLADYRTEESNAGNSGGNILATDSTRGSLKQNRSSMTSVVSEVSLCPEADDLENSSLTGDNTSEADGNESDSSSCSGVSTRGVHRLPVNRAGMREASYVVNGKEIAASSLGQFPSIADVLQASAAEHRDQGPEVNGETRSRTDSICSRWAPRRTCSPGQGLQHRTPQSLTFHQHTHCFLEMELGLFSHRLQCEDILPSSVSVDLPGEGHRCLPRLTSPHGGSSQVGLNMPDCGGGVSWQLSTGKFFLTYFQLGESSRDV